MKRFAIVLLIGLFLLIGRGIAIAGELEIYVATNTTATRTQYQVPVTTIVPGRDVILGFRLTPFGTASTDPYVELHDAATTATQDTTAGTGTMFDALESDNDPLNSVTTFYPKPKPLSLGLSLNIGQYMAVIIFYERRI